MSFTKFAGGNGLAFPELANSYTFGGQINPTMIALADGGHVVGYTNTTAGTPQIALDFYDAFGNVRRNAAAVLLDPLRNTTLLDQVSLTQLSNGQIVALWGATGTAVQDFFFQKFDASGNALTGPVRIDAQWTERYPSVVANNDGGFIVLGNVSSGVGRATVDVNGVVTNSYASIGGSSPTDIDSAKLSDGNVIVVWQQADGGGMGDLLWHKLGGNGGSSGGGTVVNTGNNIQPDVVALPGGGFAVAYVASVIYLDIKLSIFNSAGALLNTFDVSTGVRNKYNPSVALMSSGEILVAWAGDYGASAGISGRFFNATTGAVGQEFTTDFVTGSAATTPVSAIAFADEYYLVAVSDGDTTTTTDTSGAHIARSGGKMIVQWLGDAASDLMTGDDRWDSMSGGGGGDTLIGGGDSDLLWGDAGNDAILGGVGGDQLWGGDDIDSLWGGPDGDNLDGGNNFDYARYDYAATGVSARLYDRTLNTGEAAGDRYINIEGLIGSEFVDSLFGDGQINVILGLGGDDYLDGVGGAQDYLYGGSGNDQLYSRSGQDFMDGGPDFDYARYDYAASGVRVALYDAAFNSGEAAGDTFASIEGLVGTGFADDLRGDGGVNILYGMGDNDFIIGLGGADALIGGSGVDTFYYASPFDGGTGDDIRDFVSGNDRLMIDGSQFGLGSPGGVALDAFRFVAGLNATLATIQFGYDAATREVWYDYNGTAGGGRVTLAYLQVGATLVNTDILVL
jgi:Ca2+-binding RTX toxin-like protein